MSTFLAYTAPAAGHAFPLVPGLLALRDRGHDVHVYTGPDVVAPIRRGGLAAEPVDPRIAEIRVSDHEERRAAGRLRRGYRELLRRGRLDGPDLDRAIAETRPDALLVDTIAYGAGIHAERSGLPWAMTLPSLLPLPATGIPPYGLGLRPARGPLGALRDRAGWRLVERLYAKAMLPQLNELRAASGLPAFSTPMQLFDAPDLVLALTGDPLEYPRPALPANVRMTGAQPWDPPPARPDPMPWLDEPGPPWILVTCSTDYQGDERLAAAAIEALRDEPVRVLVTLADAAGAADLPAAPNARIERFVAHGPVLARSAAVVCHGGMGIVQKAMAAAVPIVAVPFGRDQPEVARRVSECGAGVTVSAKRLTPARMRSAVREAIAMAPGAARLDGGTSRFADEVEELLAVEGQRARPASSARDRTASFA